MSYKPEDATNMTPEEQAQMYGAGIGNMTPEERAKRVYGFLATNAWPQVEIPAFGFTHEDVELLNRCANGCDGTLGAEDDERVFPDGISMYMRDVRRLWSIAAKIAALLPPATTT